MASKRKAPRKRGKVRTTWDFTEYSDMTFPADGYALPRRLNAHATENPELPDTEIDVDVEVDKGRARATSVKVTAQEGVGWTALSKAPVRDIVGTAILTALHTAKPEADGRVHFMPLGAGASVGDDIREIVQAAVRYAPDLDRFERERAS